MTLPVYLISLLKDNERRSKLKENFPKNYDRFKKIEAVDGRNLSAKEFFEKTKLFVKKQKRQMLPAELGCSLSHIKALNEFLSTKETHALIIEDDIIGGDLDIDFISEFVKNNSSECIVFCGCQEGVLNRYKYGWIVGEGVIQVAHSNRGNYSRTAAYVVSRKTAQCILDFHLNKYITVADFWGDLLHDFSGSIFYISRLSHEVDLRKSNIEGDRVDVNFQYLCGLGVSEFLKKVYVRIKNEIKKFYFRARGSVSIEAMR